MTHPAVDHVLGFFHSRASASGFELNEQFESLAIALAAQAPNSSETTVALRKLLEAKDAANRALLSEGW